LPIASMNTRCHRDRRRASHRPSREFPALLVRVHDSVSAFRLRLRKRLRWESFRDSALDEFHFHLRVDFWSGF
jgi:hypothetical protein